MEAAQMSISTCVDKKLWYIYTMEYCSAIKKKKILLFAKVWMDLENTMLSEIGQLEEDKYHMISFICGIYWTNWTNKENGDRLVDGEQDDN